MNWIWEPQHGEVTAEDDNETLGWLLVLHEAKG
jgi:hypothetical protein